MYAALTLILELSFSGNESLLRLSKNLAEREGQCTESFFLCQ